MISSLSTMPVSTYWRCIGSNGSGFCAISDGSVTGQALTATSDDGVTWVLGNPIGFPVSGQRVYTSWESITWNGSLYCAVGSNYYNSSGEKVCAVSSDGATWTLVYLPFTGDLADLMGIAWNGSVFCAPTDTNSVVVSADGVNWTSHVTPLTSASATIAWNGTVFCIIQHYNSNKCATSPDGVTWTAGTMPASAVWRSVAWNGTLFCAVTEGSTTAATSSNGLSWTAQVMPSPTNFSPRRIAGNGEMFSAVRYSNTTSASTVDGTTWEIQTFPASAYWIDIAWNGRVFCAIASGSAHVATSPDGTWADYTLEAPNFWTNFQGQTESV